MVMSHNRLGKPVFDSGPEKDRLSKPAGLLRLSAPPSMEPQMIDLYAAILAQGVTRPEPKDPALQDPACPQPGKRIEKTEPLPISLSIVSLPPWR